MDERIIEKLYEKFALSTRQGQGGMTFKYVPNEDVINRMNQIFQGNWSTKVLFRDVSDDQVILEVAVSVVDPSTQMTHSHTGFGSQQIMRYNSGPNAGKIIDIGNGYKGALAKAIVNACTRWGVGLYKEEDAAPAAMPAAMPTMPAVGAAPAAPTPEPVVVNPVPAPPVEVVPPPVAAPAPAAAPTIPNIPVPPAAAPAPTPPSAPAAPVAPPAAAPATPMPPAPVVEAPPVAETTTTFPPPMTPNQPVAASIAVKQEEPAAMPKIPSPTAGISQAPAAAPAGLDSVNISDVQKVALNGILSMNNADYNELAAEAFTANSIDKAVPPRENLSYEEAVVVIKFGNEKYRKNR